RNTIANLIGVFAIKVRRQHGDWVEIVILSTDHIPHGVDIGVAARKSLTKIASAKARRLTSSEVACLAREHAIPHPETARDYFTCSCVVRFSTPIGPQYSAVQAWKVTFALSVTKPFARAVSFTFRRKT